MNKEINSIVLRRKNKIFLLTNKKEKIKITEKEFDENFPAVTSFAKNLEAYGYTASADMFNTMLELDIDIIKENYKSVISLVKEQTGADKTYNVMYPNFPQQVIEMDDIDLFYNAILHYFIHGKIMPEYEKDERFPLFLRDKKLKVLELATENDIKDIFYNLVGSKTSISIQDKEDISAILDYYYEDENKDIRDLLPVNTITHKEVGAFVCAELVNREGKDILNHMSLLSNLGCIKTYTDILRLATALSGGDISLAENAKFKLKRYERKLIMNLLISTNSLKDEDLYAYKNKWIRLCEVIHPSDFKSSFYANSKVIKKLEELGYSDYKPKTFNSLFTFYMQSKDIANAINLLKTKPTMFARNLDYILRVANKEGYTDYVIDEFNSIASSVASPVLIQLMDFYNQKLGQSKFNYNVYTPKGNTLKPWIADNKQPNLDKALYYNIIAICDIALANIYSNRPALGKVYIDKELKNYAIPSSQRSASSGANVLTRYSHMPILKDTNIIRSFIWWTNNDNDYSSQIDVDLSAGIYDNDWKLIDQISYTNLKGNIKNCVHSGDIVNGGPVDGKGVAECIDIDINEVCKSKGRYIVFQMFNFSKTLFSKMSNCRFGWMERNDQTSGEIFEPLTVKNLYGINSPSTACIPVIFDCEERKYIWLDINGNYNNQQFLNNLEANIGTTTLLCSAMVDKYKSNLYDIILKNVLANKDSILVANRNMADIIFSNDTTKPVIKEVNIDSEGNEVIKEVERNDVDIITTNNLDYFMSNII